MLLHECDSDKSSKDLRMLGGLLSLFFYERLLKHEIAPQFSQPTVLPLLGGLPVGAGKGKMWKKRGRWKYVQEREGHHESPSSGNIFVSRNATFLILI